jgi:2-keto-4-pentenoate hydratase/2-oxohepta-3-ene-1,7-dioic acid hydratase in catechol pathway
MLGKSFDTHCPFGPSIVTADEIGDPHVLGVRSFVNGELRQNSNTRHLVFNIWQQIAELSQAMTLEPGDLIFTGTPGGVGFAFKPRLCWPPRSSATGFDKSVGIEAFATSPKDSASVAPQQSPGIVAGSLSSLTTVS